ncbi:MAG: hypothetical protein ACFFB8_12645 [Promethearchaeota archaeon]
MITESDMGIKKPPTKQIGHSQLCPRISNLLVSFVFNVIFFYELFDITLISPLEKVILFGPEAPSGG